MRVVGAKLIKDKYTKLIVEGKPAQCKCMRMQCSKCPLFPYELNKVCIKLNMDDELINAKPYLEEMIEKEYHPAMCKNAIDKLDNAIQWEIDKDLWEAKRKWGLEWDNDCGFYEGSRPRGNNLDE